MRNVDLESPSSSPTINSGATLAQGDTHRGNQFCFCRRIAKDPLRAGMTFRVSSMLPACKRMGISRNNSGKFFPTLCQSFRGSPMGQR